MHTGLYIIDCIPTIISFTFELIKKIVTIPISRPPTGGTGESTFDIWSVLVIIFIIIGVLYFFKGGKGD